MQRVIKPERGCYLSVMVFSIGRSPHLRGHRYHLGGGWGAGVPAKTRGRGSKLYRRPLGRRWRLPPPNLSNTEAEAPSPPPGGNPLHPGEESSSREA